MKEGLLIGELSDRLGISNPTIRYYEKLGLIASVQRTNSGYRLYSEKEEERLRFIQKAKQFGLSLEEIKELIAVREKGTPPCRELKQMVKAHIEELDQHLQEVWEFREELKAKYQQMEQLITEEEIEVSEELCHGKICGLIENNI